MALAYTVRDRLLHRWVNTLNHYQEKDVKVAFYLSAEYLPGPHLANNMLNLNIDAQVREAMAELDIDIDQLIDQEEEPGLGNGGLGRLAACFLDSLATLQRPAIGYGIRYEFGIFDQVIKNGWQEEITDKWLRHGNPWEIVPAGGLLPGGIRRPNRRVYRWGRQLPGAVASGPDGQRCAV